VVFCAIEIRYRMMFKSWNLATKITFYHHRDRILAILSLLGYQIRNNVLSALSSGLSLVTPWART